MKYKSIEGKFNNILGKIPESHCWTKKMGGGCYILNNFENIQRFANSNAAS